MKSTTDIVQNPIASRSELSLSTANVLLVGNNPLELAHCSQLLSTFKKRRFKVDTAFNSEECFKKAIKSKPSAIILDDSVGFMNLIEITEKLYKDSRFQNIPVVILKSSNYYHAGMTPNAVDFVLKEDLESAALPEKVLTAINTQQQNERFDTVEDTLEKKMSKLFMSLFGSKKASA